MQLYTVREQLAADRRGTLNTLASFGYRAVECFDALSDPAALRADLDAAGLTVCSTHLPARTDRRPPSASAAHPGNRHRHRADRRRRASPTTTAYAKWPAT